MLLRVDEEGGQRIAVDVFEERDEPHGMRHVGERLRDLVAVGLLEKRDEPVGRDLWEKEEGERERAFRGSRSRRRTRARAWRRGFPGIFGCPASARSRGSYERSEGQRGSRGKDFEGEEVAELFELAGVQRFADGFEGFDVLVEKVKTFLVLVPRDHFEIFLFVNEIEELL